jgi:hypothetical protein
MCSWNPYWNLVLLKWQYFLLLNENHIFFTILQILMIFLNTYFLLNFHFLVTSRFTIESKYILTSKWIQCNIMDEFPIFCNIMDSFHYFQSYRCTICKEQKKIPHNCTLSWPTQNFVYAHSNAFAKWCILFMFNRVKDRQTLVAKDSMPMTRQRFKGNIFMDLAKLRT